VGGHIKYLHMTEIIHFCNVIPISLDPVFECLLATICILIRNLFRDAFGVNLICIH